MIRTLIVLGALLGLAGCAGNPPMQQDAAEGLRAGTVAVAFAYPEKRIQYDELVYKVLWNEMRSSTASFDGIWDIDGDLSDQFARQFRVEGLRAVPLGEVLDGATYAQFTDTMSAYHPRMEGAKLSVSEAVRAALLDKDIDYLIAMRAANLHVQAFSLGVNPHATLSYQMNVIDLKRNEIVYATHMFLATSPEVGKSAREIEDNGLAKLRAGLSESLRLSFEKDVVPKQLGMVAASQ